MTLKYRLICICSFLLLSCGETQKKETDLPIKKETVSLYLDLEGNPVKITDFEGKRVLLSFWATWCASCLKEMPSLVNAQEILEQENYVFLFPTIDNLKRVKQFQINNNYPFRFLQYKGVLESLKIYALPVTFIYDTKGNEVIRIDGATEWDSEEIITKLKAVK